MNWNTYKDVFPVRYLQHSAFDDLVIQFTLGQNPVKTLDVGGGIDGTQVLKGVSGLIYLLDPFIDNYPHWMAGNLGWDTELRNFDLIVCRGSINYLTRDQIRSLRGKMRPGGFLLANTFLKAPMRDSERPFTTASGVRGLELSRIKGFVDKTGGDDLIVGHRLEFESGPVREISHQFFYYPESTYESLLPGTIVRPRGTNSADLIYQRVPDPDTPE